MFKLSLAIFQLPLPKAVNDCKTLTNSCPENFQEIYILY